MQVCRMTKADCVVEAHNCGAGAVAYAILAWQERPSRKLRGLVRLLRAGRRVAVGASVSSLLVDGRELGWSLLESPQATVLAGQALDG